MALHPVEVTESKKEEILKPETLPSPKKSISDALIDSCSGIVGSVIALVATYPLKSIYTLQALDTKQQQVQGVIDVIKKYKLSGLFVGIEPAIVESAASNGVYFYFYSKLRELAVQMRNSGSQDGKSQQKGSSKDQDIGFLASLLVPAVAGVGNQLITMPLSVITTRMQAVKKARLDGKTRQTASMTAVTKQIYAESGLGGFWAGLIPSLVLISNPAIQYAIYEQLLRALKAWKRRRILAKRMADAIEAAKAAQANQSAVLPGSTQSVVNGQPPHVNPSQPEIAGASGTDDIVVRCTASETFFVSALAKIGATLATYWLVVVKARMQAAGKSSNPDMQYKGTWDALMRIVAEEGFSGFFKGLKAKILQTALNAALMLMLKEQIYLWTRKLLTGGDVQTYLKHLVAA